MVQMTAKNNLSSGGIGARDGRSDHAPMAGANACVYVCAQNDFFMRGQAGAKKICRLARNHEGETRSLTSVQMPPANQRGIKA